MKCPHCLQHFHEKYRCDRIGDDVDRSWFVSWTTCAACRRFVINLVTADQCLNRGPRGREEPLGNVSNIQVHPLGSSRATCPAQVPNEIASDYREACLVLPFSPKASAALSRRCLQHLLRDAAKVKKQDLAKEIDEVLASNTLPTYIASSIDAIRQIGNFAAHPMKSTNTGAILEVEPHEAQWNLDELELLFDFYYVQPALTQKKIDDMNAKLASANKPPMK